MAPGSEASWPHSQPASPLPVLGGSPLPGSPKPPASPRDIALLDHHRSFRDRLADFAIEHEELQARNEALVAENRDLRERLERAEAACGRGGGRVSSGVGEAASRVGGGSNSMDEGNPEAMSKSLPSQPKMHAALPLWHGSATSSFSGGHPGSASVMGDVEGFEKRVERLLSSKPAPGGNDKIGSAAEASAKAHEGSGSSSSTDDSEPDCGGRTTHKLRRRRRHRRRRSHHSKPRHRIRRRRRGGNRCRSRGQSGGRSRSRKRQPLPVTQPAASTVRRADLPRGFFGSGDHRRDLQDFCSKNQLEARVVAALHSMSEVNQRKVMGTNGSGENSYLLVDRVKNPNGVVMSRIRKVEGH